MKIVIVDTTLHGPLIGGAQTFLPGLIKDLKNKGHEIHLVSKGNPDKKIRQQLIDAGAILHTGLFKKSKLVDEAAPFFAKWVNKMRPDIYLISVSGDIGWLALPYLNPSIATITIGHTDSQTFYAPARHYHSFLTKAIAVSDQVCEEYISDCGLLPQQVKCIPYGVKVNIDPPVEHNRELLQIVYVGRIDETQKRISDLAAIAKQITAKNLPFHLKVIGDGPERSALEEKLADEIAAKKVEFTGWLENEKIINLLRQSDVFVLTSAYEGFCIALVEAMANGCCPVVTNIRSGNKQLIRDSENGFINEIGDVNAFVDKLTYLQQNRSQLEKMRIAAWQMGKKYSIPAMADNYEECFLEAIQDARATLRKIDPGFPVMESCRSLYPRWIRRIKKLM